MMNGKPYHYACWREFMVPTFDQYCPDCSRESCGCDEIYEVGREREWDRQE